MGTVPTEITAVAGTVLTAATWNATVRDLGNFVLTPPMAILRQATGQSTTSGTWTAISFDASDLDRDAGHSNVTNNSRYTSHTTGYYEVAPIVVWTANATGARGMRLEVNGGTIAGRATASQAANGLPHGQQMVASVFLNAGDYVEIFGNQTSGGALATVVFGDFTSMMTVRWISTA